MCARVRAEGVACSWRELATPNRRLLGEGNAGKYLRGSRFRQLRVHPLAGSHFVEWGPGLQGTLQHEGHMRSALPKSMARPSPDPQQILLVVNDQFGRVCGHRLEAEHRQPRDGGFVFAAPEAQLIAPEVAREARDTNPIFVRPLGAVLQTTGTRTEG